MDERIWQTLLYDFYGELLTLTQKKIYEMVVFDDASYSEIGINLNMSRAAVGDSFNRSLKKLKELEKKLALIDKFEMIKGNVITIRSELDNCKKSLSSQSYEKIKYTLNEILEKI